MSGFTISSWPPARSVGGVFFLSVIAPKSENHINILEQDGTSETVKGKPLRLREKDAGPRAFRRLGLKLAD